MLKLLCAGGLALLLSFSVLAQVPPPPRGQSFMHPDRSARVFFTELDTARGLAKLEAHLQRRPEDSRGWSARAFWHSLQGRSDEALADLERARGVIDGSPLREREVLWSEGWIRLNLGQVPEAREAWTRAVQLHGGRPYWASYSFAVLAELGGERHIALQWYAIAAADRPAVWGTRHGMLAYTRHWNPSERAAIVALYEAWRAAEQARDAA